MPENATCPRCHQPVYEQGTANGQNPAPVHWTPRPVMGGAWRDGPDGMYRHGVGPRPAYMPHDRECPDPPMIPTDPDWRYPVRSNW